MTLLPALAGGVVAVLFAQFPMESFAEQSDLGHWIQHGVLFWGGVAVGAAGYGLWRRGQRGLWWWRPRRGPRPRHPRFQSLPWAWLGWPWCSWFRLPGLRGRPTWWLALVPRRL